VFRASKELIIKIEIKIVPIFLLTMASPIYIVKTTKAYAKTDVCKTIYDILGPDAIDRILSIDGVESELRVFIIAFWRIPLVNQFHNEYTEPGDILNGAKLPWALELLNPYGIFSDGHYPAPHFLRNSHNLNDAELEELGIGGAGEFIYVQLPTNEGTEFHWEMYRSGTYYMPDMSYYNTPHLEPLTAVNSPRIPPIQSKSVAKDFNLTDFTRWRDFYIEHPKTWPKDLTEVERASLEETYARIAHKSPWTPQCGRDPTNLAEEHMREAKPIPQRMITEPFHDGLARQVTDQEGHETWMATHTELTIDDLPRCGLTRSCSVAPDIPIRSECAFGVYPCEERTYMTDDYRIIRGSYKWNFRSFD